jgi:aspartate kinase
MTGKIAVGGITRKDGLVLVRILGAPAHRGLAGRALSGLGLKGINISCVTSFVDSDGLLNICFAVGRDDLDQTLGILQGIRDDIQARTVQYTRGCSAISVYGPHFSERPAIAGTIFQTTAEAGVEVLLISTSFSTVSFVTGEDQAELAVSRLHENFLVP